MSDNEATPTPLTNWDVFDSDSPYVSWHEVGETLTGVVTSLTVGADFNGQPVPEILLATDDGAKILTCGQANLKAQIVALKPAVGDTLTVTFDREEKAAKGMRKVFKIDHTPKAPF